MAGEPFGFGIDYNTYCRPPTGHDFRVNTLPYNFPDWLEQFGFDWDSSHVVGSFTGPQVFVRSNRFETGRAHLIVYNWTHLSSVPVDVSSVLPLGGLMRCAMRRIFLCHRS